MHDCIFCKIINSLSPADKVYETEHVVVIEDRHPQAPKHYLVIPKKHISDLLSLGEGESSIMVEMTKAVQEVAKIKKGLAEHGFRTVVNNGHHGGQTIFHLHMHILGGRQMTWPPG
ncbi:MAG: histidine triad nucleotide-binding protein [Nitrospinae bacterium]|nr:histidine triad nucleotide-binding protein [Nitrospinota bacterium]